MLAVMFATAAGYGAVLMLGAAAYFLAFLNLRHFTGRLPVTSSSGPRRS
jgi:predicted N-acetyltransferase YhbS